MQTISKEIAKTFAEDFLKISNIADNCAEFLWLVYKMKTLVPQSVFSDKFSDYEKIIDILTKAGAIKWVASGSVRERKDSIAVALSDDFKLKGKPTREGFKKLLLENYGYSLIENCRSPLVEQLIAAFAEIVYSASPQKPVFVNKIIRRLYVSKIPRFKELIDCYLNKFLALVTIQNGFVNISEYAKEKLRNNQQLWSIYAKESLKT